MLRISTAAKLTIARLLRGVVGAWFRLRGRDARQVRCTRNGVRWLLDLDEGVQLALYLGVYERSTTRALARLASPDAVVVDVGANIGAQALPLASRLGTKGRVIAVEPADAAMVRLRKNCALNPALSARMTLVHRALVAPGDTAAKTYFARWPLAHAVGAHPVHQGAPEPSSATGSTLDGLIDELGLTRVDLIKLDVDGNELPVLRGATATLARHQPIVLFELCPYLLEERGEAPRALTRLFIEHGYALYDERTLERITGGDEELIRHIPAGGSVNVVAAVRPLRS
jgi:FkbM family methyltransferase